MRDCFGGGDEVAQANPLIGCRPFLVDADVAWTVLHGRDAELFLDDISVTHIAEAPMRAHHSRRPRGQDLALGQRGDELPVAFVALPVDGGHVGERAQSELHIIELQLRLRGLLSEPDRTQ
jgi:hypothetical protein